MSFQPACFQINPLRADGEVGDGDGGRGRGWWIILGWRVPHSVPTERAQRVSCIAGIRWGSDISQKGSS